MSIFLGDFIRGLPKAELHMHLEGSIEPHLMLEMARRNAVSFPYRSVEELSAAFDFKDLQSFLDVLWAGNSVLQKEQDFYEMTWGFLAKAHEDGIRRTEVFLSPQAHLTRGVAFKPMLEGVLHGLEDARRELSISADLIVGFQRNRSEAEAFEVAELALPYRDKIIGVGLGATEANNPPSKFERVFARCRSLGWRVVAHAGEEGPAAYIKEALDVLKVDRIDHGVRCEEDPELVKRLADLQIPLTVCPLSNVKLKVFPNLESHNLDRLFDAGLMVTVNSDDPTQFGGYLNDNLEACAIAYDWTRDELAELAKNSFKSAFISDQEKRDYCREVDAYLAGHAGTEAVTS